MARRLRSFGKRLERSVRALMTPALRDRLRPYAERITGRRRSRTVVAAPPLQAPPPPGPQGLVSVIMPIYDRTWELREAIESVMRQTYAHWELILVTDGSPPETVEIVESYRGHPQVRIYHYLDNTGTAVRGRNRGIKEARGEYVAFLDSDDVAVPERLALSVAHMESRGVDVVYGGWTARLDGSRQFADLRDGQFFASPDCDLEMLRRVCVPCQSTVMVRRQALLDVGGLKPTLRYREDHELWMRLAYFGYRFGAISDNLIHLRLHAGNNELNFKGDDAVWEREAQAAHVHRGRLPQTIAYLIPGTGISGGIAVILEHANRLLREGFDVFLISQDGKDAITWWPGNRVPIVPFDTPHTYLLENIDVVVATGWTTVSMLDRFAGSRKLYFVQSDERRFADDPEFKRLVHATYLRDDIEYFSMARWICRWLAAEFGHRCGYVPNGIEPSRFRDAVPLAAKGRKVRILMEGPTTIPFKGMDDAAEVLRDFDDCEVWIVSADGRPKPGWRCDRFFEAVPHAQMPGIYASCDILLKMSRVESFCYPPLEMMATGGSAVVREVTGLEEYAVDGGNCLVVSGVEEARRAVRRLVDDAALRVRLGAAGRETAGRMDWAVSLPSLLQVFAAAGPAPAAGLPAAADMDVADPSMGSDDRSVGLGIPNAASAGRPSARVRHLPLPVAS